MEKKIEIKPENGIALRVSLPGETQDISFADITKYWDFGDEDSVDHISYMTRGDHVFFLMLTEDRQNGAVAGWDIGKKELFHMSEGSYAISMKLFDGELYTLCRVANPVVPEHFQIYRVPVGTFDRPFPESAFTASARAAAGASAGICAWISAGAECASPTGKAP